MFFINRKRQMALLTLAPVLLLLVSPPLLAEPTYPAFEIPVTTVAVSDELVAKPMPPRPDGSIDKWPSWEFDKVTDNVYAFRGGLHRSMVVVTSDGVVIVDAMRKWTVEEMVLQVAKITDQPITHVIYSHNHLDHTRGASVLQKPGVRFIAHEFAAREISDWPHPDVVQPDTIWRGATYEFSVGDTRFELHYLGENHGQGMSFIGLPDQKLMYICDVISPGRLPPGLMPDFSPRGLEATLKGLSELDYETIVNGHEHTASTWDAIPATLEFYQDLRAEVRRAMEKAGGDIAPWTMIRYVERLPKYKDWRYYNEWYMPIAGRIIMEEYLHW